MADDAIIEVILQLQDNMTAQLSQINSSINGFSNQTQDSFSSVTNSFSKATNGLLALGNVAQAYEEINSAVINSEIRLENAELRVENAQQRLSDSQNRLSDLRSAGADIDSNVIDLQSKLNALEDAGNKSGQVHQLLLNELNKAKKEQTQNSTEQERALVAEERAQRQLEIAENNQQRVQEQLIGTYIQIGMEVLRFAGSLPQLIESISILTDAEVLLEAITNPVVLALGLAAGAAGIYAIEQIKAADASTSLRDSTISLNGAAVAVFGPLNNDVQTIDNLGLKSAVAATNLNKVADALNEVKNLQSSAGAGAAGGAVSRQDLGNTSVSQAFPINNSLGPFSFPSIPQNNTQPITITIPVNLDGLQVGQAMAQISNNRSSN